MSWWSTLLRHSPPPPRPVAVLAGTIVVGVALEVLRPWPLKLLVDDVLTRPPKGNAGPWLRSLPGAADNPAVVVMWLLGVMVAVFVLSHLVRTAQAYVQTGIGCRMSYRLGAAMFEKVQELSLLFHGRRSTGDLVRRIMTDSGCIRELFLGALVPAAASVVSLGVMFMIMWRLDRLLSLVALSVGVPLIYLIRRLEAPMSKCELEQDDAEGELLTRAERTLAAVPVVQSFTQEGSEDRGFAAASLRTVRAAGRAVAAQLRFKIGTGVLTAAGTAAVMVIGGLHVLQGTLTIGSLLVFLSYLAALYGPMESLAYASAGWASASAGAKRVLEVLQSGDCVTERPGAMALTHGDGGLGVRFEGVTFGYGGDGGPVLSGVDLDVPAGSTVAVVGPSGAGKSTLAALIPRLADAWEGRVTVHGHDVRDLRLASLRGAVAVVGQDPLLLPISVFGNIAYGRPGATRREVEEAARAAGAHEFVARLPGGYDAVVGERGATLSGGERQRVAIARALLKAAPVLVLDEPTSALDAVAEQTVMDGVARLKGRRTCIVIAHRLSAVRGADLIVVLDGGRVVETGTHRELMSRDGLYAEMYRRQMGGAAVRAVNGTAEPLSKAGSG